MKKISLLLVLACSLFMSGCTDNAVKYNSFDEYSNAMKEVRAKYNSYTIEAKIDGKLDLLKGEYKLYLKKNKWKEEISSEFSKSQDMGISTTLYNGSELLTYSDDSDSALVDPSLSMVKEMMKNDYNQDEAIKSHSRLYRLFNWSDGILSTYYLRVPFKSKITKKNGFECRMIESEYIDVCVSDKYGIAVYSNSKKIMQETVNVTKIDTSDIKDSVFELPKGMKKETYADLMKQIQNISDRRGQ